MNLRQALEGINIRCNDSRIIAETPLRPESVAHTAPNRETAARYIDPALRRRYVTPHYIDEDKNYVIVGTLANLALILNVNTIKWDGARKRGEADVDPVAFTIQSLEDSRLESESVQEAYPGTDVFYLSTRCDDDPETKLALKGNTAPFLMEELRELWDDEAARDAEYVFDCTEEQLAEWMATVTDPDTESPSPLECVKHRYPEDAGSEYYYDYSFKVVYRPAQ